MKIIYRVLFIIISFIAVSTSQANEAIINNNFTIFSNDPLTQAVYEVGFINGVLRNIPVDSSLNTDAVSDLKTQAQQVSTLMNFVCAQIYVNHLKDLRDSKHLDFENHYNKNSPLVTPSPLSTAVIQGGQRGAKLMTATDKLGQAEVISQCHNYMRHLKPFLCSEFERSYRKLFDLEDANAEAIQHPYHAFFCSTLSDKSKEDL